MQSNHLYIIADTIPINQIVSNDHFVVASSINNLISPLVIISNLWTRKRINKYPVYVAYGKVSKIDKWQCFAII